MKWHLFSGHGVYQANPADSLLLTGEYRFLCVIIISCDGYQPNPPSDNSRHTDNSLRRHTHTQAARERERAVPERITAHADAVTAAAAVVWRDRLTSLLASTAASQAGHFHYIIDIVTVYFLNCTDCVYTIAITLQCYWSLNKHDDKRDRHNRQTDC